MATKKKGNNVGEQEREREKGGKEDRREMEKGREREREAVVFSGDRGPALGFEATFVCQSVHSTNTSLPGLCMNICVYIRCIYIWPRVESSGFWLVLARARAHPSVRVPLHLCTCGERVSGSGGFIIRHRARRVSPGQCVVKKKRRRACPREERGEGPRREREERRRGTASG